MFLVVLVELVVGETLEWAEVGGREKLVSSGNREVEDGGAWIELWGEGIGREDEWFELTTEMVEGDEDENGRGITLGRSWGSRQVLQVNGEPLR